MKKFTLLIFVSLLSFFSSYGQLWETFEDPWTAVGTALPAPAGWTVINEQGPQRKWERSPLTGPSALPYAGLHAAYLERENVLPNEAIPRDWLITPFFNMPANAQLRFFSRLTQPLDQGSIYKVKLSTDPDPANLAAYQDLVTWTETQINPVQTDYYEKVLTLPSTITGNVHIAFVMEGDQADRWLIDNVRVASQCIAPITLTTANITMTTATFNWINPGNATDWEIEIVPDTADPTANGVDFSGPPTYTTPVNTLAPDTKYKVYVRAVCTNTGGAESGWLGPVYFETGKTGEHCNYPIVIPSGTYSTTDNTSNYADNYEATGSTGCNTSGNYLSGNDVVYSFTPTANGTYSITLSNTVSGAGVYVYSSCANIGVNCVAGGTGNANLSSVAMTAGTTYYIVVSTSNVTLTTPYTLTLQQVFCAPPTGLATANPTPSSADITWAAGTYTSWQFAVVPTGAGLPTGNGQNVTTNTVTATQTLAGAALSASTSYDVYVRANCGDGTYSIWTGPVNFLTTQNPDSVPYAQNWENDPHLWTLSNGTQPNKWVVGTAANNGGTKSLYISNDNGASNSYTINSGSTVHAYRDVIIPPTATSLNLAFDWRSIGETNDNIRVFLIPVSVTPAPGTAITPNATNIKVNATNLFNGTSWATYNGVINVSGMGGTPRRLVFEWVNNTFTGSQQPAAIDNINLTVITCPAPSNPTVVAGTLTPTQVNINWTVPTSVPPQYDYYMNTTGTTPTGTTAATGQSSTTTATNVAITPSATHYFWVRANCGPGDTSTWAGPLMFIAPQIPETITYTQNFDGPTHGWSLNNGTQANKWVVGSATSNSPANSLYISNDNGTTNAYNNTSASVVQAYRDLTIPPNADQLNLTFDYKSIGETTDYFRIWMVPVTFNPTAGTQIGGATGRVQIGGNIVGNGNSWINQTFIIQAAAYANTTMRFVFEWRNDGTGGTNPPAAIDNINLTVVQCPQPSALALASLTAASANFTWTAPVTGVPGYEYFLTTDTTLIPTAATAGTGTSTAASVSIPGLPPSTNYNLWVRSDCGTSKSLWIGPVNFTTPQDPSPLNYSQNFDGATHGFDFSNTTATNKWVVGTATSNSADKSLYISNNNGVNNNYTITSGSVVHAYRDIQLPSAVDQVLLSFDWKNAGESTDYIKVWLVPVDYILPNNALITAGAGRQQIGGTLFGSPLWSTSNNIFSVLANQGETRRLVFEWRNDTFGGNQPPAAIDNINFSIVTCPAPTNLAMPLNNAVGTTFTWTPPVLITPTFDFYYSTSPTPPTGTTTPSGNVATPTVTLTGLPDSTNYYFWVRDNCGPGDTSLWLGPFAFSTPQVASPLNYTQNFDGNTHGWTITNGNQTNKWMVGTATSNSPGKSLYITENFVTNTYNFTAGSVVHAYKDFIIPAGTTSLDLTFDWKNAGQTGSDYVRVWRVPVTFVPTPGTGIGGNAERVQIAASLTGSANWTTFNNVFDATTLGTSTRIVFEWVNNTFTGTNPPGAIDNIDLSIVTCPKPTGLGANAVTQTGATFNWTETGTAAAWELYIVPAGQPAPNASSTGVSAGSNPYTYTTPALLPSTNYVYYVRSVCAADDKSKWAGPFAFRTAIGNDECTGATVLATNPYTAPCQNFGTASYDGATPSPQPFDCQGVNGADIWFEFVATNDRHNIELSDFSVWHSAQAQPIVIALYEGEQCSVMSELGCSITNVFVARNLTVGATYRFRLFINSLTPNLSTSFKVCVNTPPPPNITNTDACTVTTINHSFEVPAHADPNANLDVPSQPSQHIVPGWRTTASDNRIEFWPTPNYEGVPAYDGNQFVELNAEEVAALYQDYATPQPTTFTYKFAHRGRMGTDTCKLLAGSPNDQNNYAEVTTATTPNTGWTVYTGTYTSPPGQLVTRFIFQSASTHNGDDSVGNFLDAIEFTADNGIVTFGPENLTCADDVLSVEASGSGEWSPDPNNPSETVITDPESNITTITGFRGNGEYRFDWTTQYCKSTVVVFYNNGNVPVPVVTSPVEYCVGETAAPLNATALAGHTLNWYTTATGGTASATAPTPDTSVNNNTIYYVAQQAADTCESDRVAITVNVYSTVPAPVAQTAYIYCQDVPATPLTATVLPGHTLRWYTVPTNGTASATAITPSTATAGVTSYYVSQANANGCESNRTEIVVTVNPSIIPVTGFSFANNIICVSDSDPVAVPDAGFSTGGIFTSGAGLVIHPVTGEINLGATTPGSYTVTYTIMPDEATCNIGGTTSVQITVTPLADAVTSFSYNTVCSDAANQLPSLGDGFATGGTFTADAGLVIDAATGEINVAASTPGSHTITYTVGESVANCTAAGNNTASINIVQAVIPVLGFDYDDNFCYNGADATPTLAGGFSAGGSFAGTSGLAIDATTGIVDVASSTPGTHTVTYTYNGDAANCIHGGASTATFTIGTELNFDFEGFCDGSAFVIDASGEFDNANPNVSFRWATASGAVVGTNSHILNVTDYANSTPENETFPMDFSLTITIDGCETTRTYTVDGIGCTIQRGISPNNDGLNDNFDLEFMGVKKLSIFNRYGQEVYTRSNYTNEWYGQADNGNELPTGTYYYVIERIAGGTNTGWIYINREE